MDLTFHKWDYQVMKNCMDHDLKEAIQFPFTFIFTNQMSSIDLIYNS